MKNFKYVSPLDFLSPVQAKMPYDDRVLEQKKSGYCVGISCDENVQNEKQQEKR